MGSLIPGKGYAMKKSSGLRRRWLRNTVGVLIALGLVCVLAVTVSFAAYYYSNMESDMRHRAKTTTEFFADYLNQNYNEFYQSCINYAQSFEDRNNIELQFINAEGQLVASSYGQWAGTSPVTTEIQQAVNTRSIRPYVGVDPATGERIIAVSSPMIYSNGEVIGEGWHRKYGEAHAEVNAIASVKDKSLLKDSTIYVNLEPCCHWGKTPPCANLIIESGINRCVIANTDPNPKVYGGGIKLLRDNGVEVINGVLEEEGNFLNRRFFTNQRQNRPYIIIKYAKTEDGFIATENGGGWISNDALKVWVHKQRTEEDAIMVGYNTVLCDNPKLNVRHYAGRNPKRVVFDRNLSLPKECNILDNTQDTFIFNHIKSSQEGRNTFIKIDNSSNPLPQIMKHLYENRVCSVVVEGGKKTIEMLIKENLWDEAYVIVGETTFNKGINAPKIPVAPTKIENIGNNRLEFYLNK